MTNATIVLNGENLRILSIMVLSILWLYWLVEALAVKSLEQEHKNKK